MFTRIAARLPVRALAAPRAAVRFNSSTTTSTSSAARVLQMAAEAERPSMFCVAPYSTLALTLTTYL